MEEFLADLHIHTVLSPCGDLEMTPRIIVEKAMKQGLAMIAITDHNSTKMCHVINDYAEGKGLTVIPGVEVNTIEEVHCLAYFPDWERVALFQQFLDENLLNIKNKPSVFGHQVAVDTDEKIFYTEKKLLITGINSTIGEVERIVHQFGGLFVPAHIFRRPNGILHQLGMIPDNLNYDALEMTPGSIRHDYKDTVVPTKDVVWIFSSDAHYPEQIGKFKTRLWLEKASFEELKLALKEIDGRKVIGLQE